VLPAELRVLIADNIRELARDRDKSLNIVADLAGIQRSAFYRALGGQQAMTTDRLAKSAEVLEVPPHQLLVPPAAAGMDELALRRDARVAANPEDE